jgi:hypothetical protein
LCPLFPAIRSNWPKPVNETLKASAPRFGYKEGNAMGLVSAITFTLLGSVILLRWMEASLRKS